MLISVVLTLVSGTVGRAPTTKSRRPDTPRPQ